MARLAVERRVRRLAARARAFHEHRLNGARLQRPFQLDEMEPFGKGRMTPLKLRRRTEHQAIHGRRRSRSARAVRQVPERLSPPDVRLAGDAGG